MTDILCQSQHLSLFQRDGALFVYHDLIGYILEMDLSVYRLLAAFRGAGRTSEDVTAASGMAPADAQGYIETLREHYCLVPQGFDELHALSGLYPVWAPWAIHYSPEESQVELALKDRDSGRMRVDKLNALDSRLWNLCCGQLTIAEMAERLQHGRLPAKGERPMIDRVLEKIAAWTHSRAQLLKLIAEPIPDPTKLPPYVKSSMPYERIADLDKVEEALKPLANVVDLRDYHKSEIQDAQEQFEVGETTLSHMFRHPHPALGGQTYGESFAQQVLGRGLIREGARVVEVGGGVGWFARRFLEGVKRRSPDLFATMHYAILELSPALQASQAKITAEGPRVPELILGDALAMPFSTGSVDFLVSNEMIGDLPTAQIQRQADGRYTDPDGDDQAPGPRAIAEFGLKCSDAGDRFWLNTGAYDFLREIRRVLKPEGSAILTEFGEKWAYPVGSTQLDHREFSIHFGHLQTVAEALGFSAEVVSVPRFLNMQGERLALSTTRNSFEALRALFAAKGVAFEKQAYTEEAFAELCQKAGLDPRWISPVEWKPIAERVLGLKPKEFKAILLGPKVQARRGRALEI